MDQNRIQKIEKKKKKEKIFSSIFLMIFIRLPHSFLPDINMATKQMTMTFFHV